MLSNVSSVGLLGRDVCFFSLTPDPWPLTPVF